MTAQQLRDLAAGDPRPCLRKVIGTDRWACASNDDDECIGSSPKGAYARWRMTLWKLKLRARRALDINLSE